jgi:preprotein translocase subunit SecE
MAEEEQGFPEPGFPEPSKAAASNPNPEKVSLNPTVFLQETQKELGQVTWPSRQQLISESIAVIAMVALSATLVYFLDDLFVKIQGAVFPQ